MNDLMRPALYNAEHKIFQQKNKKNNKIYEFVGPVVKAQINFLQKNFQKLYEKTLLQFVMLVLMACL